MSVFHADFKKKASGGSTLIPSRPVGVEAATPIGTEFAARVCSPELPQPVMAVEPKPEFLNADWLLNSQKVEALLQTYVEAGKLRRFYADGDTVKSFRKIDKGAEVEVLSFKFIVSEDSAPSHKISYKPYIHGADSAYELIDDFGLALSRMGAIIETHNRFYPFQPAAQRNECP